MVECGREAVQSLAGDGMVAAVLVEQRMAGADADGQHLADDDDMAVPLDRLLDDTIDGRGGIDE